VSQSSVACRMGKLHVVVDDWGMRFLGDICILVHGEWKW